MSSFLCRARGVSAWSWWPCLRRLRSWRRPSALGQFQVDGLGHEGDLADLDTRTASIAPSQAQLDAVADLGAVARWTDFGTPESLIRYGGFLAEGIQADSAAEAALSFLDANRSPLPARLDRRARGGHGGAAGRQRARRRLPADRGRPARLARRRCVGWARSVGKRLEGRLRLLDARRIGRPGQGSPSSLGPEALAEALDDAGEQVSVVEMAAAGSVNGWRKMDVAGLRDDQLFRRIAFATPSRGMRVAFETALHRRGRRRLPSRRRRRDRRHPLPRGHGRVACRQPELGRLPGLPGGHEAQRLPVRLPEHRHA